MRRRVLAARGKSSDVAVGFLRLLSLVPDKEMAGSAAGEKEKGKKAPQTRACFVRRGWNIWQVHTALGKGLDFKREFWWSLSAWIAFKVLCVSAGCRWSRWFQVRFQQRSERCWWLGGQSRRLENWGALSCIKPVTAACTGDADRRTMTI